MKWVHLAKCKIRELDINHAHKKCGSYTTIDCIGEGLHNKEAVLT